MPLVCPTWRNLYRVIISVEASCWNYGLGLYRKVTESPSNSYRIIFCSARLRYDVAEKPLRHDVRYYHRSVIGYYGSGHGCNVGSRLGVWYVSSAVYGAPSFWQPKEIPPICLVFCRKSSCVSLNVPAKAFSLWLFYRSRSKIFIRVLFRDHNLRFVCLWTHLFSLLLRNVFPVSVLLVVKPLLRSRNQL